MAGNLKVQIHTEVPEETSGAEKDRHSEKVLPARLILVHER
jgi:hypothetical protein